MLRRREEDVPHLVWMRRVLNAVILTSAYWPTLIVPGTWSGAGEKIGSCQKSAGNTQAQLNALLLKRWLWICGLLLWAQYKRASPSRHRPWPVSRFQVPWWSGRCGCANKSTAAWLKAVVRRWQAANGHGLKVMQMGEVPKRFRFAPWISLTSRPSRAWRIKETFTQFWSYHYTGSAKRFFDACPITPCAVVWSRSKSSQDAQTPWDWLLNYSQHRINNACAEGFNSAIQLIKANARGFRNFNNYRARILFHCGKLDMRLGW